MTAIQFRALQEAEFHFYRSVHPELFHPSDLGWGFGCFALDEIVRMNTYIRGQLRSGSLASKPGERINVLPHCIEAPHNNAVPPSGATPPGKTVGDSIPLVLFLAATVLNSSSSSIFDTPLRGGVLAEGGVPGLSGSF